jgi:hypothetical protein
MFGQTSRLLGICARAFSTLQGLPHYTEAQHLHNHICGAVWQDNVASFVHNILRDGCGSVESQLRHGRARANYPVNGIIVLFQVDL